MVHKPGALECAGFAVSTFVNFNALFVVCIPSDLTTVGQSAHGRRIYRIHSQDEDGNFSRGIRRYVE
jgi:hypothetical protein